VAFAWLGSAEKYQSRRFLARVMPSGRLGLVTDLPLASRSASAMQ
jgi:hypothetical protein